MQSLGISLNQGYFTRESAERIQKLLYLPQRRFNRTKGPVRNILVSKRATPSEDFSKDTQVSLYLSKTWLKVSDRSLEQIFLIQKELV